jgi:hypothetical protein
VDAIFYVSPEHFKRVMRPRLPLQDGLEWNYRVVYPGDAGFLDARQRFEALFGHPKTVALALSGVRLELVVVPAEQLHQLGVNEELLFAERHFAQHAQGGKVVQVA